MVVVDAWRAVARRWHRNLLMVMAVMVSAGTAISLIAFIHSAAYRTATTLTALSAGSITATLPAVTWQTADEELLAAVRQFPQVTSAGTMTLPGDGGSSSVTIHSTRSTTTARAGVAVVTPGGIDARKARLTAGTLPGAADVTQPTSALVGRRLARELGIGDPRGAVVEVNGVPIGVAGILADSDEGSILSTSLLVEPALATRLGVLPPSRSVLINVTPGTAEQLANDLAAALHPRAPEEVGMSIAPSPRTLQDKLAAESATWVTVITAVLGAVSAFTIVTTMQVAIQERRREIGIRRAIGTRASRIALQFCCEAMVTGGAASAFGAALGAISISLWGALAGWEIVMPPYVLLIPLAGLLIGGLSGLVPALLATKIDPAELLRTT
ncbi:MAG: ABC transporter permease [Propionibacteriales bacterium]|nr:ABC transporter permease [Propionibacteriales bacterium]